MPGWPYPCTTVGNEFWQVIYPDGVVSRVLLCSPHADRLRGGAKTWMESQGLKLAYEGIRRSWPQDNRRSRRRF